MKRHELQYLEALQDFSKPLREHWRALWIDDANFEFEFLGSPSMYRYWDATPAVEFVLRMADEALEVELRRETQFLRHYDAVLRAGDERFDVRGSTLSTLVMMCLDNGGVVSKSRRKQFAGVVPEAVFEAIERATKAVLDAESEAPPRTRSSPSESV